VRTGSTQIVPCSSTSASIGIQKANSLVVQSTQSRKPTTGISGLARTRGYSDLMAFVLHNGIQQTEADCRGGILSLLADRDGSLWIGTDSRIGDHYLIAGQARSICHGEVMSSSKRGLQADREERLQATHTDAVHRVDAIKRRWTDPRDSDSSRVPSKNGDKNFGTNSRGACDF